MRKAPTIDGKAIAGSPANRYCLYENVVDQSPTGVCFGSTLA
jgi:hypothetical protein